MQTVRLRNSGTLRHTVTHTRADVSAWAGSGVMSPFPETQHTCKRGEHGFRSETSSSLFRCPYTGRSYHFRDQFCLPCYSVLRFPSSHFPLSQFFSLNSSANFFLFIYILWSLVQHFYYSFHILIPCKKITI